MLGCWIMNRFTVDESLCKREENFTAEKKDACNIIKISDEDAVNNESYCSRVTLIY